MASEQRGRHGMEVRRGFHRQSVSQAGLKDENATKVGGKAYNLGSTAFWESRTVCLEINQNGRRVTNERTNNSIQLGDEHLPSV